MEPQNIIFDLVTLLVALYGAALATFLGIKELGSDRLSAIVSYGWSYSEDSIKYSGSPDEIILNAVNSGRRDLVVSSLSLEIKGFCCITPAFLEEFGASKPERNVVEGHRLCTGDRIEARFDIAALKRLIGIREVQGPVSVRAVLEDTLENFYCSSWFEIRE